MGRGIAARCARVGRDRDSRVHAAPGRPGSGGPGTALAPALSRVALAGRRSVPDGACRARYRAVGSGGQAPRRTSRAASGRRAAYAASRLCESLAAGCRHTRQSARRGARSGEAWLHRLQVPPVLVRRPASQRDAGIAQGGFADRGGARWRRSRLRHLHRVQRVPVPAYCGAARSRARAVSPRLVRGTDPVREREGNGAVAARPHDPDRHRRAPAVALRVPRNPRECRMPHRAAGSDACRRA